MEIVDESVHEDSDRADPKSIAPTRGRPNRSSIGYDVLYRDAQKLVPEFSKTTEVGQWLSMFHAASKNLLEADQIQLFKNKMIAKNLTWLTASEESDPSRTAASWIEALRSRFQKAPDQLMEAITLRKMKEDEDPEEFVSDIQELCLRYNPKMSELEQIGYVRNNLHPSYTDAFLFMNAHVITMEKTAKSLVLAVRQLKQKKKDPVPRMESSVFAVQSDPPRSAPRPKCGNCGKTNHTTEKCYGARRDAGPHQSFAFKRHNVFRGRCFNCNEEGHRASDCNHPKQSGSGDRNPRSHKKIKTEHRRQSPSPQRSESGNAQ